VGAGLSGLTAAGAFRRVGRSVSIFEQTGNLMPLQRETAIRYIHPTINYWPEMSLNPSADMPFLYWAADVCKNVVATIERQWRLEFGDVSIKKSRVLGFERDGERVRLQLEGGAVSSRFDAVIVATGFGLENSIPGTIAASYWDNSDLFNQRNASMPRSFVISGSGDGGLLEILRLAYRSFDSGKLVERIARKLDQSELKGKILEAEEECRTKSKPSERHDHLRMAYLRMHIPAMLSRELKSLLVPQGKIQLLARGGNAFTPQSAPIHRFLLAQAVQNGAVSIENAELVNRSGSLEMIDSSGNSKILNADVIIARHGTTSAIERLLSKSAIEDLRLRQEILTQYQYHRYWPEKYFDGSQRKLKSISRIESDMIARLRTCHHLLEDYPGAIGFQIVRGKRENSFEYAMVVNRDSMEFSEGEVPPTLFGTPLRVLYRSSFRATAASPRIERGPRSEQPRNARDGDFQGRRALRIGDRVLSSTFDDQLSEGRIGCFLTTATGQILALTAGHVLDDQVGAFVSASSPENDEWAQIGSVKRRNFTKESSSHDDLACFLVEDDIAIDPKISGELIGEFEDPLDCLQKSVWKISSKSGRGRVEGYATQIEFLLPDGQRRKLEDVLVVSFAEKNSLSKAGDSGSIICSSENKIIGLVVAANDREVLVSPINTIVGEMNSKLTKAPRSGRMVITEGTVARQWLPAGGGSFREQVEAMIPALHRYSRALAHDADIAQDLVQDTLVRALRSERLFLGGDVRMWLYTILTNLNKNRSRRLYRTKGPLNEGRQDAEDQVQNDIARALSTLVDEQRSVLLLVMLEGLSYREVADIQGVPIGTVMSRLARARAHVQAALGTTQSIANIIKIK
jgi:RNA polymerase sigma-70 factor (ECF subfamily)